MLDLLRRYLRRVDLVYLCLCAVCSALSVLVLLSSGRAERYDTLSRRCGEIPLMDTRSCGAIILHIDDDGLTVEALRQAGKDEHGS